MSLVNTCYVMPVLFILQKLEDLKQIEKIGVSNQEAYQPPKEKWKEMNRDKPKAQRISRTMRTFKWQVAKLR